MVKHSKSYTSYFSKNVKIMCKKQYEKLVDDYREKSSQ